MLAEVVGHADAVDIGLDDVGRIDELERLIEGVRPILDLLSGEHAGNRISEQVAAERLAGVQRHHLLNTAGDQRLVEANAVVAHGHDLIRQTSLIKRLGNTDQRLAEAADQIVHIGIRLKRRHHLARQRRRDVSRTERERHNLTARANRSDLILETGQNCPGRREVRRVHRQHVRRAIAIGHDPVGHHRAQRLRVSLGQELMIHEVVRTARDRRSIRNHARAGILERSHRRARRRRLSERLHNRHVKVLRRDLLQHRDLRGRIEPTTELGDLQTQQLRGSQELPARSILIRQTSKTNQRNRRTRRQLRQRLSGMNRLRKLKQRRNTSRRSLSLRHLIVVRRLLSPVTSRLLSPAIHTRRRRIVIVVAARDSD